MQKSDIISVIDELNQYSNGNVTTESLIETLSDLIYKLKNNEESKSLDLIAEEVYGEFGFDTCTLHQQKEILTKFINKELCS